MIRRATDAALARAEQACTKELGGPVTGWAGCLARDLASQQRLTGNALRPE